jgi:hypothetical protein
MKIKTEIIEIEAIKNEKLNKTELILQRLSKLARLIKNTQNWHRKKIINERKKLRVMSVITKDHGDHYEQLHTITKDN